MIICFEELFIKINGQEVLIAGEFYADISISDPEYDELAIDSLSTTKDMFQVVCIKEFPFIWEAIEKQLEDKQDHFATLIHEQELAA